MFRFKRSMRLRITIYSCLFLSIGLTQAGVDIYTVRQVTDGGMAVERTGIEGAALLGNIDAAVESFRLTEIERALAFSGKGRDAAEAQATQLRGKIAGYEHRYEHLAGNNAAALAAFDHAWSHYLADHENWALNGPDAAGLPGGALEQDDTATDAAVDALVDAHRKTGLADATAQERIARETVRFDLFTAALCVLFTVITQIGARMTLIRPLQAITGAMTSLAAGERDTAVPWRNREDEIGEMAAACEVFRLNVVALDHAHEAARRAEEQAQLLARHDALTGLPNRRLFSTNLETALARAQNGKSCYALLLIDLDDFKKVNDIQGHQAGDVVLCEIGRRLEAAVRQNDTLARLGGDEFAIITQSGAEPQEHLERTRCFAARLLGIIRAPIEIGDTKVEIGASIGIASFCAAAAADMDVTGLLRAADIAMYRAKQSGRSSFCFFEQSMDDEMRAREALERDVAKAIADGSIRPHYQPLVDIGRQRIRGFEALARWNHPERGNVPPDVFIPIIEQLGLTAELSKCILRHACQDARHWPREICVAINVSPMELKDRSMPARFAKILQEEGFPPRRLEVEVTESALVNDLPTAKAILAALQDQGITICLDDFGTGYSSLYHLRELRFDKIKIDRSFVQAMRGNAESEKIIDAILGLTGSMNLPVVAEGIEDAITLRMLTAKGCELGQGYYFGKAMPAASATALLAQGMEAVPA